VGEHRGFFEITNQEESILSEIVQEYSGANAKV